MIETDWTTMDGFDPLYQTDIEEEGRVASIHQAFSSLEQGAQFAFYDLQLSVEEQYPLSQVKIQGYNNIVFYLSQTGQFQQEVDSKLSQLHQIEIQEDVRISLSNLITRIVSNVLATVPYQNAEIVLRIKPARYDKEDCLYWHIDKSHGEMMQSLSSLSNPISTEKHQALFVIPLLGNTTFFQEISQAQRLDFLSIVNETKDYYGHTISCSPEDEVNTKFRFVSSQYKGAGYGSVHLTGRAGTLHTAPYDHDPRMMLLITPINYINQ